MPKVNLTVYNPPGASRAQEKNILRVSKMRISYHIRASNQKTERKKQGRKERTNERNKNSPTLHSPPQPACPYSSAPGEEHIGVAIHLNGRPIMIHSHMQRKMLVGPFLFIWHKLTPDLWRIGAYNNTNKRRGQIKIKRNTITLPLTQLLR